MPELMNLKTREMVSECIINAGDVNQAEVSVSASGAKEQGTEQAHGQLRAKATGPCADEREVVGVEDDLAVREAGFPGKEGSDQSDQFPECDVECAVSRVPCRVDKSVERDGKPTVPEHGPNPNPRSICKQVDFE